MFDASLEVAPGLDDAQLLAIPAKRGVLALAAANDQPILLLTAADLRARLRTRLSEPVEAVRRKSADLREITRKILWKLSPGHFETDLNYLELARAIWPQTYTGLLAYKPPWMVHVDAAEKFPHFVRTREVTSRGGLGGNARRPSLAAASRLVESPAATGGGGQGWPPPITEGGGLHLGPFESGQGADKFIQAVEDAFDLCRDYQCLRASPHGQPCAYLQMGRCVGPCNGTISLEEYRGIVARAAAFAQGERAPFAQELQARMKEAAARLQFEKAGVLKSRLERLEEFNAPRYRFVAPLEQFRFILVQSGAGRKRLDVFLVNGPAVMKAAALDYPLVEAQVGQTLATMADLAAKPAGEIDEAGLWRMGLVAHYLLGGPQRAGAIARWKPGLVAGELTAAIEARAEELHLKK